MNSVKNTVTEMKNASDRLINRLDTAEESVYGLEGISIDFTKTEKQKRTNDCKI